MTSGTTSCAQVAEAFDDWFPLPQSHLAAGGGVGWREQLFILMTLLTAEDSSLIDTPSEDLACSLETETVWG